jgi:hypothetical protein
MKMHLQKDQEPWRRFVDGVSYDVSEEEVALILKRLGFSSMEEFKGYADSIVEYECGRDGTKIKNKGDDEQLLE